MNKVLVLLTMAVLNLYPATFASEKLPDNFNLTSQLNGQASNLITTIKKNSYYEVDVYVTAYSEGDDCYTGSIMASGKHVYEGAVAYNNAPLGTVVEIEGSPYVVEDRVARDDTVDIYMNSKERALKFGRNKRTVKIRRN